MDGSNRGREEPGSSQFQPFGTQQMFATPQSTRYPTQERVWISQASKEIRARVTACSEKWLGCIDVDVRNVPILTTEECYLMRAISDGWIKERVFTTDKEFYTRLDQPLVAMIFNGAGNGVSTIEDVIKVANSTTGEISCLRLIVGRQIVTAAKEHFGEPLEMPVGIYRELNNAEIYSMQSELESTSETRQRLDNNTRVVYGHHLYEDFITTRDEALRQAGKEVQPRHTSQGFDEGITVDGVEYPVPLSSVELAAVKTTYLATLENKPWIKEAGGINWRNADRFYLKLARCCPDKWPTVNSIINKIAVGTMKREHPSGALDEKTDKPIMVELSTKYPRVTGWFCRQLCPGGGHPTFSDKAPVFDLIDGENNWSHLKSSAEEEDEDDEETVLGQQALQKPRMRVSLAGGGGGPVPEKGQQVGPVADDADKASQGVAKKPSLVPPNAAAAAAARGSGVKRKEAPKLEKAKPKKGKVAATRNENVTAENAMLRRRNELFIHSMGIMSKMADKPGYTERMHGWRANMHKRTVKETTVYLYMGIVSVNDRTDMVDVIPYICMVPEEEEEEVEFTCHAASKALCVAMSDLDLVVFDAAFPRIPTGKRHGLAESETIPLESLQVWYAQYGEEDKFGEWPSGLDRVVDARLDVEVKRFLNGQTDR